APFRHPDAHLAELLRLIAPNMCHHRLLIGGKDQSPFFTENTVRVAIAFRIRELRKKHIGTCSFRHHFPEHHIRDFLHRREYKEWPRQITPKILFHIQLSILSSRGKKHTLYPKFLIY